MIVTKEINDKAGLFKIEGRLDTSTVSELEDMLKDIIDDLDSVTFDFEKLEYISSSGLRLLLSTNKQMSKKGGFKVKNVTGEVMEILDVTGFSSIITIEE